MVVLIATIICIFRQRTVSGIFIDLFIIAVVVGMLLLIITIVVGIIVVVLSIVACAALASAPPLSRGAVHRRLPDVGGTL